MHFRSIKRCGFPRRKIINTNSYSSWNSGRIMQKRLILVLTLSLILVYTTNRQRFGTTDDIYNIMQSKLSYLKGLNRISQSPKIFSSIENATTEFVASRKKDLQNCQNHSNMSILFSIHNQKNDRIRNLWGLFTELITILSSTLPMVNLSYSSILEHNINKKSSRALKNVVSKDAPGVMMKDIFSATEIKGNPLLELSPSVNPSTQPTMEPSVSNILWLRLSLAPTFLPTQSPTISTTHNPTIEPTVSNIPWLRLSLAPTFLPTQSPTISTTHHPPVLPSHRPTLFLPAHLSPFALNYQSSSNQAISSNPTYSSSMTPSYKAETYPLINLNVSSQPSYTQSSGYISSSFSTVSVGLQSSDDSSLRGLLSIAPTLSPTLISISTTVPSFHSSYKYANSSSNEQPTLSGSLMIPTTNPSVKPTKYPSMKPAEQASRIPTLTPSNSPNSTPSSYPSTYPSFDPSTNPTTEPSFLPISSPSFSPTSLPSYYPSNSPSLLPSIKPSISPTSIPSGLPTNTPSIRPSTLPSEAPTSQPSTMPTLTQSQIPSTIPSTHFPSSLPTNTPSVIPSMIPTDDYTEYLVSQTIFIMMSNVPDSILTDYLIDIFEKEAKSKITSTFHEYYSYSYTTVLDVEVQSQEEVGRATTTRRRRRRRRTTTTTTTTTTGCRQLSSLRQRKLQINYSTIQLTTQISAMTRLKYNSLIASVAVQALNSTEFVESLHPKDFYFQRIDIVASMEEPDHNGTSKVNNYNNNNRLEGRYDQDVELENSINFDSSIYLYPMIGIAITFLAIGAGYSMWKRNGVLRRLTLASAQATQNKIRMHSPRKRDVEHNGTTDEKKENQDGGNVRNVSPRKETVKQGEKVKTKTSTNTKAKANTKANTKAKANTKTNTKNSKRVEKKTQDNQKEGGHKSKSDEKVSKNERKKSKSEKEKENRERKHRERKNDENRRKAKEDEKEDKKNESRRRRRSRSRSRSRKDRESIPRNSKGVNESTKDNKGRSKQKHNTEKNNESDRKSKRHKNDKSRGRSKSRKEKARVSRRSESRNQSKTKKTERKTKK